MTNPFAIIALHAFDSYHKSLASVYPQHTFPKALLYTVGTTIVATVIYKSVKRSANSSSSSSSNFLSTFLKPFHDLFNRRLGSIANDSTPEQMQFEDKYFKEYDEWIAQQTASEPDNDTNTVIDPVEQKHKRECLENMYNITVRDTINDFYGDVIMCYDHATLSFAYYARTANIPYKYLETISRKYMIETNAPREIHIDIRNEYKKAKDRKDPINTVIKTAAASTDTKTDDDDDDDDENVFVKLKSYNTVSNLNLHTTTNDTIEKTHKFVTTTADSNSASKPTYTNKIIRERANRYSYRGKINDFAENHRRASAVTNAHAHTPGSGSGSVSTSAITSEEVKDYAEFKRQMMQTRSAL